MESTRDLLLNFAEQYGTDREDSIYLFRDISAFETGLETMRQRYRKDGFSATVLVISPGTESASSEEKSSKKNIWGTYTMPHDQQNPLLTKRQQPEKPLEEDTSPTLPPVQSSTSHIISQQAASSPLPGILPACFPSLATCNSLTRNCTGHGSCALKYENRDTSDNSPYRYCYSCSCSPSTSKDSEGKVSTTYWGGPACQKRDVSVQFSTLR